jgi:hypothetical protein
MGERDLEFVWVGDDAIDPLQQAQTLNILVSAGIKTREEARAELGLGGAKGTPGPVTKRNFDPNQPRDEDGRWTTEGAGPAKPEDSRSPPARGHKETTGNGAGEASAYADVGTLVAQRISVGELRSAFIVPTYLVITSRF